MRVSPERLSELHRHGGDESCWQETVRSILRSVDTAAVADTGSPSELLRILHDTVSSTRCLVVLDNFESLMEPAGTSRGSLRADHLGYEAAIRVLALGSSGLTIITSRERPAALDAVEVVTSTLPLSGMTVDEAAKLGLDAGPHTSDHACSGRHVNVSVVAETSHPRSTLAVSNQ